MGANVAVYVAKHVRVARAVLLSGPAESVDFPEPAYVAAASEA